MDRPLVISVVVPVYGVEKYIAEFAESLFSQSYPHIQFIFVNDGTKDASIDILNSLIDASYPHLRDKVRIINKKNGGLPAARKTGMDYVTGDYVCHMDPDDWISPDSISRIAATAARTGADFIYYHYVKEYLNRSSVKKEGLYSIDDKSRYIRNMYNHRAYGTLCNKCVRTEVYRKNDVCFPRFSYAEDCFLSSQLAGYSKSMARLDEVVYHYRKFNSSSITHQGRKRKKREYAMNFLDLYEKYKDVPENSNPVSCLFDDILIQAGWYSILYGFGFFKEYPYLARAVFKARMHFGTDVNVFAQLLVKIVAAFHCL